MGLMDRIEKESLSEAITAENKKCCADCKTTKTPLWRGGPTGPKSLCNACGIRYRKRRISMVGLSYGSYGKRDKSHCQGTSSATTTTTAETTTFTAITVGNGGGRDVSVSLKTKLMALGKDWLLHRSPSVMKKKRWQRRRKLKEEEQAAVCLMALSGGSVFA